mgnify:CR=1 FL=1
MFSIKAYPYHESLLLLLSESNSLNNTAEKINSILKNEWLDHEYFFCFEDAKLLIDEIISIYNNKRSHSSCDKRTPSQCYQQTRSKRAYFFYSKP